MRIYFLYFLIIKSPVITPKSNQNGEPKSEIDIGIKLLDSVGVPGEHPLEDASISKYFIS